MDATDDRKQKPQVVQFPLSVVVGVKDHIEVLDLFRSVDEKIEVILVLNNTPRRIRRKLAALDFPSLRVKLVETPTSSLGQVRTAGVEAAQHDLVFVLDADCTLEKGTLRRVYDCLQEHEIGRANVVIRTTNAFNRILANTRQPHRPDFAYMPGVFFRKSIREKLGREYFREDVPWREDYEFAQRVEQSGVNVHFLQDAIVYHPPYRLIPDLTTAFRCGGGQQICCDRGYVKPSVKYGGGRGFLQSVRNDLLRLPQLYSILLYQDARRFGTPTACYKLLWRLVFSSGYYTQLFFDFLGARERDGLIFDPLSSQ